ncbi:response regulator transcription factor [Gardnerella vaginalis]|uniref:response regulator transcription factor n=1 Tax=Gardnerella TaxID=2701 RepID=UPI0039707AC1
MNTTYAIVDNDTLVLRYMQLLLKSRLPENFVCAWMCSSAKQAIHRCVTENTPDVLLVDMSMREMSGVDVIKAIRERNSNIVLIGITSYMLDEYVLQVAKSGGQALIHKDNLSDVVAAIQSRATSYGCPELPQYIDYFHTPQESFNMISQLPKTSVLSPQESEIMRLCKQGSSTKEIADQLNVKVSTVNTHLRRIYGKLQVKSRMQALAALAKYSHDI